VSYGHFGTNAVVSGHFGTGAEVSYGHFGTGAEVSYGHFGTSAKMSWVRSVLTPKDGAERVQEHRKLNAQTCTQVYIRPTPNEIVVALLCFI